MMGKRLHEQPEVYAQARTEMLKHVEGVLPAVYDPFSGGGSIPLEANRMGFTGHAGDLNPVAVLLNKCNLELAPLWSNRPPINPDERKRIGGSEDGFGTRGLAADVRYYGRLVRERTQQRSDTIFREHGYPWSKGVEKPLLSHGSGHGQWQAPIQWL
jgi:putative DNA methylase